MSIDMPMNCSNSPEIKRKMIALLPSLSRACQLCEIFLEFGEYLYASTHLQRFHRLMNSVSWCALPRGQLFDEILGVIYRSAPFVLFTNSTLHR